MNFYFLVEGRQTEKRVYRSWMAYMFPQHREVQRLEDLEDYTFFLIAGYGYPSYLRRIQDAFADIERHKRVDYFFICVDAEEQSPESKRDEIVALYPARFQAVRHAVIVHNCCIETWFLGNDRMLKRFPESAQLRAWKAFYDVSQRDPESMGYPSSHHQRAHFHLDYLKVMFREHGLTYSKTHPGEATAQYYLEALITRHERTNHLKSFGYLMAVWRSLGGRL